MSQPDQPLVINGWTVLAHPLFMRQFETLLEQVEHLRQKDPNGYLSKNPTKRLKAVIKLAFQDIPQDPTRSEYRQGDTLGEDYKHWFRVKFFQQYRLFFRYHKESRVILLAWVNDEKSKRAYESETDAYKVFKKMLDKGCPPDNWDALIKEAAGETRSFGEILARVEGHT